MAAGDHHDPGVDCSAADRNAMFLGLGRPVLANFVSSVLEDGEYHL